MKNDKNPRFFTGVVSIIMPTHNSEEYVEESVGSILSQTYQDFELYIIDDASTDNTVDILKRLKETDKRIHISINSTNSGAAVARNVGLKQAQGQFIAFLDSDDTWRRDKLERQLKFMKDSEACFSFSAYQIVNEKGENTGKFVDLTSKEQVSYKDMLAKRATLGCSTVIFDQSIIGKVQMPLIRTGQDYALWLKILKKGYQAKCLREVLTFYRIVPGSISRNKYKKAKRQWQIYRDLEKINLLASVWYFINYAWRAVFRA